MNLRLKHYFEEAAFHNTPSVEAVEEMLEELEYVCFVKVSDFTQLAGAESAVHQEQWSVFLTNRGEAPAGKVAENNVRVRSINDEQFFLTSKFYLPGADGKWEIEREVERKHFDLIKSMASGGMRKDRYKFPVADTEMVWEVDVHYDDNGDRMPWVRLELEVKEQLDALPPLPLQGSERILNQPSKQTDAERRLVKELYKQYILTPVSVAAESDAGDDAKVVHEAPTGDEPLGEKNDVAVVSDDVEENGEAGARLSEKPTIVDGSTKDDDDSEELEESEAVEDPDESEESGKEDK